MKQRGTSSMSSRTKGVLFGYVYLVVHNASSFLLTPFMIYVWGQGDYGLFKLVTSFTSYFMLVDLGIGNSIVRYMSEYRTTKNKAEESSFLGSIYIVYVFVLTLIFIGGLFLRNNLEWFFSKSLLQEELLQAKLMTLFLVFNGMTLLYSKVFYGIFRSYEKFALHKLFEIMKTIIRAMTIYIILKLGLGPVYVVAVDLILNTAFVVIAATYTMVVLKVIPSIKNIKLDNFKTIFSYSSYMLIAALAFQVFWSVDVIVLGIYTSTSAVAVYSIGALLNTNFQSFSFVMGQVLLPGVVAMVKNEASHETLTCEMIRIGRMKYMLLCLALIGFIFLGDRFIVLWAGKEYYEAYYVMVIIVVPQMLSYVQDFAHNVMLAKNKHKVRSVLMIGIALGNIILTVILVRLYGTIGAAVATSLIFVIGELIVSNLYYMIVLKLDMIRFYKEVVIDMFPCTLLSSVGAYLIRVMFPVRWSAFILQVILVATLYLISAWFIAMNKREKFFFVNLIRSRKISV